MYRFTITKKAVRQYHSYNPHYFPFNFLRILFQKVSPYFNLWMSAEIVTALYEGREKRELYFLVFLTLAGNFFLQAVGAVLNRLVDTALKVLENEEAAAFYKKTLSLDYNKIESPKINLLRRKIRENAQINGYGVFFMRNLLEMLFSSILDIIFSVVLFAEMVSFLTTVSFQWAGLLLLLAMMGFIAANIIVQAKNEEKSSAHWDKVSTMLLDENRLSCGFQMQGMDSRLYRQQAIVDKIDEKNNKMHLRVFSEVRKKIFSLTVPNVILFKLAELCSYLVVCFYCVLGAFPVGSVIKYVGYLGRITDGLGTLFYAMNQLKTNERYLKTYLEYFDITNDMYQGSLAVEKRSDKKFDIEFKHVSFRYPGKEKDGETDWNDEKTEREARGEKPTEGGEDKLNSLLEVSQEKPVICAGDNDETYALRDINLKIKVGERLAVVGRNGSGKTTFIKLLCRLYDPTQGEVIMNDFNIRKYDYRQYLDLFSVVFQDYNLLAVPLGNNIASAGRWDTVKAEKILEEVGFGERYAAMPKGLETPLYKNFDEDGVNISGGEAQKIALARALYKDAPFIILDEPTAALDPVAEAEIYSRFDKIVGNKTAIYISHRLSSCRFCDKIAVFDEGRIVQVGTHEELLSDKKGRYYELWHAQAQYYA